MKKMGADQSTDQNTDWQGDPIVIYETDMWILKDGIHTDGTRISLFESKQLNEKRENLETLTKYLRTLRHPCIVKHLHSHRKYNHLHLITEQVTPLEILLSEDKLSIVEKVAGIYNVLQALAFIHVTCGMSHQNMCTSSVFVCADGSWKLAGFEKMQTLNNVEVSKNGVHYDDVFSFGEFALHLLAGHEELSTITGGMEFLTRLEVECLSTNQRPTCAELKNDLIFKNDFLDMRLFLQNLVLKSETEKSQFFRSLVSRLKKLHRELIAHHLSTLLLCRFVFMDSTAAECFLPYVLKPQKIDANPKTDEGLFPPEIFRKYIIPQLLRIFCVRSHHIRLILLKSFSHYVDLFTKDELTATILPEILIGIRDTNDEMVSQTLEALAKLVSILGAQVVVGGCRQKLFNEAIPNITNNNNEKNNKQFSANHATNSYYPNLISEERKISSLQHKPKDKGNQLPQDHNTYKDAPQDTEHVLERSSPDGVESMNEEDWSDWDGETNEPIIKQVEQTSPPQVTSPTTLVLSNSIESTSKSSSSGLKKLTTGLGEEFDIMAIEVSKTDSSSQNDFFSDMEPKIMLAKHILTEDLPGKVGSSLNMTDALMEEASGWDDAEFN
uniref:Protein kinase domain-containing protein n=1 Tax=Strigamia maritima TaxID=126957 RepID=T1IR13_STRMM